MSSRNKDQEAPDTVEAQGSVTIDSAPDTEFLRRRMLLKGAASAAPLVLTLRAAPALASASNCAVVEMTPEFDNSSKLWSFTPSDRTPWTDETGRIACVETETNAQGQQCPTRITGYFNYSDEAKPKDFGCTGKYNSPGGIVIAASSGGSFTR